MITKHGLERELRFYDRIEEEIITVLKSLPEGSLYFKTEHGKSRPYIFYNGKEKYLSGKSEEIINKLFKRRCMKDGESLEDAFLRMERTERSWMSHA